MRSALFDVMCDGKKLIRFEYVFSQGTPLRRGSVLELKRTDGKSDAFRVLDVEWPAPGDLGWVMDGGAEALSMPEVGTLDVELVLGTYVGVRTDDGE